MSSNLTHRIGDIFTTELPAIGHGVNVYGIMGSGIAVIVRNHFPDIFEPYSEACKGKTLLPGGMLPVLTKEGPWVFNLASQDRPGPNAHIEWLEESTEASFVFAEENKLEGFALPRIGAGIGGLVWADALAALEKVAALHPNTKLEIWSLPDADEPILPGKTGLGQLLRGKS